MLRLFSSNLRSTLQCRAHAADAPGAASLMPRHPTQNPHVPEGRYEAIVHDVKVSAYGRRDNHDEDVIVRIVFFLPDGNRYMVSDIDLPKIDRKVPFQRLQEFATVLRLDPLSILETPELASGRRLRVYVKPVDAQMSGAGRWYSDVDAFERLNEDET